MSLKILRAKKKMKHLRTYREANMIMTENKVNTEKSQCLSLIYAIYKQKKENWIIITMGKIAIEFTEMQ